MTASRSEASGSAPFRVRVLGPLQVMHDGQEVDLRGPRPRLLLGILISRADQSVALDRLIDDLYGDEPPPTARKSAQVHISNLRGAFGEGGPLVTLPGGYSFDTSEVEVDAIEFEREVEAATALAARDPEQVSFRLAAALARWHGAPYSDLGAEQALQAEITRLSELRLRAIELRIDADLRLGRHAELLGELETLTTDHPYREQLRGLQMLALYRSGRQADALRVFGKTRALLVDELGIEPSAELSDLESRILDQSPALALEELPDRDRFAFLVTDIEDSTVMWEHDPDRMGEALARHDEILEEEIEARQGRVFKHTGDGVLAVFPTIGPAVDAGIAIQTRLQAEFWPTDRPIRVRAAVDEGTVERRGDDYFGPVMNRVARIMSAAHGGQLLVSEPAAAETDARSRSLGDFDLKGVGRVGIHQMTHGHLDEEFPDLRTDRSPVSFARPGFERAIRGYELREELGAGDFGVVYRAYQASVGREVAVKVIRPEFANRSDFVKRFEAEAQFVAQLEHPHIVSLYDYWRDPEGAYLVMNYLRGGSLAQALGRGTWNPPAVLRLVDQIGTALAYAHRNGVTHRDIKPGNVLLDDDGNAYLSDFGIAARTLELDSYHRHTSVAYVAPEQLAGAPVDARSDIYALALLTYEMITGQRPELGGQPRSVREVRHDLPAELDVVFDRATTAVPDQRYARVEDLLRGLRQAFGVDTASAAPRLDVDIRNPFKGLRAFTEIDAADFYGREAVVEQLIEGVRTRSFTAAVGPSGCGKSSVIKAGLLPAVRSGALGADFDFVIAEMFPGSYPFEELESSLLRVAVDRPDGLLADLELDERGLLRVSKQILPDDQTMMLLVIDQFEELFSLVTDDSVRDRFLDSLVTVANDDRSRVRVLATMRADFFDRPLQYPEFGEVLKRGLVPIAMPTSDNLALAISQPARSVGLELEPGLVSAVVGDVADQPGGLPLMQYAMTELVDRRESNVLTLDAYHSTGGAPGALARRAEDIYSGLSSTSRSATRDLFLRLVAVSEESDDTRRRVRLSELSSMHVDQNALGDAIDEYGAFRLLSFDHDPVTRGPTVEVAHEALIREWPRYRDWVDAQRDDLLLGRRLEAAARDWAEGERDPSFLLVGGRLEQYREWTSGTDLRITVVEGEYLDASERLAADLESEREAQERRDESLRRRSRLLLASAVAAVIMLVLAGLALVSRDRADTERARAEQFADDAASVIAARRAATESIAISGSDPERALSLAVGAVKATEHLGEVDADALDALQFALQEVGVTFPANETTPVALRNARSGLRGVFLLPVPQLVGIAQQRVTALTRADCEIYFAEIGCPDVMAPVPASIEIAQGVDAYLAFTDPNAPLAGTTVTLAGWEIAASAVELQAGIENVLAGEGVRVLYQLADVRDPDVPGDGIDVIYAEQTSWVDEAGTDGRLVDLGPVFDSTELEQLVGPAVLDFGRVADGSLRAIPMNATLRSMVYFDRSRFDENAYEVPTTWDELLMLSDQIVDDGLAPWCWATGRREFPAGEPRAGGFALSDWVSTLLLSESGPAAVADWASGTLDFSSPPVRQAFERVGQLISTGGYINVPLEDVATVNWPDPIAAHGNYQVDPSSPRPTCVMKMAPSYGLTFDYSGGLDQFAFPPIDETNRGYLIGSAYLAGMTQDRPENRAVLSAVLDDRFFDRVLDRNSGYISASLTYEWSAPVPDDTPGFGALERDFRLIDLYQEAVGDGKLVYTAAYEMPIDVGMRALWEEPNRLFFEGPETLDEVLVALDEARDIATR